jgi:hypothetical protein
MRRDLIALHVRDALGGACCVDRQDRPAGRRRGLLDVEREEARRVRARFAAGTGAIVPVLVPDSAGQYDGHVWSSSER